MADYAGAYGAGGAAQALESLLAQKFLERKQAEVERAQRADEAARQAALAQQAEQFRQGQAGRFAELAASRDDRYQDRQQHVSDVNARITRQSLEDQIRAGERKGELDARKAEREDEQAFRTEERKGRESFEALMARRASGSSSASEPLVAIMDPVTNRPVLVPRSQAAGKAPASTREQGRPVGTSDANRIADFDTSLDDLATLKESLPKGSTGVAAQAGAALPNVVTELTGLGTVAKQKQAMIDRVRQVIGKALEGGVLRKEDEAKYEKILPTLKDSDDIVAAKLSGLESALQQRRGTLLEALESSGYDVTHFPRDRKGKTSGTGAVKERTLRNKQTGQTMRQISKDGGATWEAAQ